MLPDSQPCLLYRLEEKNTWIKNRLRFWSLVKEQELDPLHHICKSKIMDFKGYSRIRIRSTAEFSSVFKKSFFPKLDPNTTIITESGSATLPTIHNRAVLGILKDIIGYGSQIRIKNLFPKLEPNSTIMTESATLPTILKDIFDLKHKIYLKRRSKW